MARCRTAPGMAGTGDKRELKAGDDDALEYRAKPRNDPTLAKRQV
jgi:hypothetical protein